MERRLAFHPANLLFTISNTKLKSWLLPPLCLMGNPRYFPYIQWYINSPKKLFVIIIHCRASWIPLHSLNLNSFYPSSFSYLSQSWRNQIYSSSSFSYFKSNWIWKTNLPCEGVLHLEFFYIRQSQSNIMPRMVWINHRAPLVRWSLHKYARAGVQASRRELHTHIHLDYVRVEILFCVKKKRKKERKNGMNQLWVKKETGETVGWNYSYMVRSWVQISRSCSNYRIIKNKKFKFKFFAIYSLFGLIKI